MGVLQIKNFGSIYNLKIDPDKNINWTTGIGEKYHWQSFVFNDPIVKNLKKELMKHYNGNLIIFEKNKDENYSDI